jgi:hypothetical protein
MVIETAMIVPDNENGRGTPIWALHDGINLLNIPILSVAHTARWVLAGIIGDQPTDSRQFS